MGWIGWTARETLAHTPYEILLAKRGRVELIEQVLERVFGKPGGGSAGPLSGKVSPTAENFAKAFAAMKGDDGL